MDIRVQKTKAAIRTAFLQLRREKQLEQITVKELSQLARISKATFYLHYRDIYDLNEQLQQEVIRQVIRNLPSPEDILADFSRFSRYFIAALEEKREENAWLFSGAQMAALPTQLERQIKDCLFERFPERREDRQLNVQLSFLIQGGFYAYMENVQQLGDKQVTAFIDQIYRSFPSMMK